MNYIITKHPEFFEKIGDYNYCSLEDMKLPDVVSVDTETTGLKAILEEIFAIQIGTGINNYLIHCYDDNYHPTDVFPYLQDKLLIGQNLTFDLGFFYKYGFYPDKVRDTFLASKILYNGKKEFRHDFGTIFEREMNIDYDKSEQKNISKIKLSTSKAIKYCFDDVDRLIELHEHLHNKIVNQGYSETYDLHCEYILALAYMEQCGVPLSKEKWLAKIDLDIEVLAEKTKAVQKYIVDNLPQFHQAQLDLFSEETTISVELGSPKQMIPVFKALDINVLDDDFKESISENVIKKTKHEFVDIWVEYQGAKHDVTTFGRNIFEKVINGRIYTGFNPILDTARISTRKGDVNTLNLPANQRTRECIVAEEGFKMIVSDYDGQETRVGADITGDKAMIESILNNSDLHCAFARVLFPELAELDDETIMTQHKKERNKSKAPRFCFQFGGTGYTLALNENLPIEEGMRIEGLFKQLHTGIYAYGDKKIKEAMKLGYIESTMGFKLHLPLFNVFKELEEKVSSISKEQWQLYRDGKVDYKAEWAAKEKKEKYIVKNPRAYEYYKETKSMVSKFFKLKSQYYRLCLNNPTQTTAAHQTKRAACMLFSYIKERGHLGKAKICIIPHDEFVMEVEDSICPEYKIKLGEIMRNAGNEFISNPLIKMGAEANVGESWYEAK